MEDYGVVLEEVLKSLKELIIDGSVNESNHEDIISFIEEEISFMFDELGIDY